MMIKEIKEREKSQFDGENIAVDIRHLRGFWLGFTHTEAFGKTGRLLTYEL